KTDHSVDEPDIKPTGEQSTTFVENETTTEGALKLGRGAKTIGIIQAINELWPHGIPTGLSAKDRDRAILDKMASNGSSIPKNPARAIQRVLKAQRTK